jgi:bacterioferritin-associated ferredoxin
MYVCLCHGISDSALREAAAAHGGEFSRIANATGVATNCGQCREHAEAVIAACGARGKCHARRGLAAFANLHP